MLGLSLRDPYVRILGSGRFWRVGLGLLLQLGRWDPWPVSIVTAVLFAMSGIYRSPFGRRAVPAETKGQHLYTVAAAVLLTMLLHSEVNGRWLSVAWAVEAALLVWAGFALKDRVLRLSGFGVCALLSLLLLSDCFGALTGMQGTPQWGFATTP